MHLFEGDCVVHCGLRTEEIRRLRLDDLDLNTRQIRIVSGKGGSERMVVLSQAGVEAVQAYLPVRGPAAGDHIFVFRHRPLSRGYCRRRLRIYGRGCGLRITPHQLRYSFATLLLNAGVSILTVQHLLGHRHVETTLDYVRLYDSTAARDYAQAMGEIESDCLIFPDD